MSCQGCMQSAVERNSQMNDLIIKAKAQAIEEKKTKAICYDPLQGSFITSFEVAIRERFQIVQVISGLQ